MNKLRALTARTLIIPSAKIESVIAIGITLCAAIAVWHFRTVNAAEAGAFNAFSPSWLANQVSNTPAFAKDFPNGELEVLKSLPMLVYPMLGRHGISGILIFKIMMFLEIASIVAGTVLATRLLRPGAYLVEGLLISILLFASGFINASLAQWWHPYYGSVYNYAYGAGLAGSALLITGRVHIGAVLLSLAYMTHPVIGLLMLSFAGTAVLSELRRYNIIALFQSAAIFITFAGAYTAIAMGGAGVTSSQIPADLYIGITRFMSYHWYPISIGMFDRLYFMSLVPLTGLLFLLAHYLFGDQDRLTGLNRQLAAGFLTLVLLTVFGVLASEFSNSPVLIKLALQRASGILLLFGAIIIIPGIWNDIQKKNIVLATIALFILIFPFGVTYGMPAFIAICLVLPATIRCWRLNPLSQRSLTLAILAIFAITVFGWLALRGLEGPIGEAYFAYDTISNLPTWAVATIAIFSAVGLGLRSSTSLLVLVGLGAIYWSPIANPFTYPAALKVARNYLAAQQWARLETSPDALFMPDPAHAYGWREASERPSFGSTREWLYTSFAYNTSKAVFDEGLKRYSELGLDARNYLKMDPNIARTKALEDARQFYYSAPESWFRDMSRRYGIRYFIFEKAHMKNRPPTSVVFENEDYLIGEAKLP
ncbi:hypothetical protein X566_17620 [Afipia sp. P52-10]|uniref:hypothetical protein n=1 Tax=Afipia sp. P52-10 TaxID=1429916 RepID=UPI0003DF0720|nr:hypothetical protein [Afipia sp. P52-10]ETR76448.1 hypothetical protein X566_17620 [Afipia sp. P52-10]